MHDILKDSLQLDQYPDGLTGDVKSEVRSATLARDGRILHLDLSLNYILSAEEMEKFRSRLLKKMPGVLPYPSSSAFT